MASVIPARWRRPAVGAAMSLATMMAAHALIETARNALFLTHFPASQLPWMYLAGLVGTLLVARVQHRWQRFDPRSVLAVMMLLSAVVVLGFWLVTLGSEGSLTLYLLYVFTGVYVVVLVTQFWLVVSAAYNISQAKKIYAFIGAGGIGGAIVGSGFAAMLSPWVGVGGLLAVAAGLFIVVGLTTLRGLPRAQVEPVHVRHQRRGDGEPLREAIKDPYLRLLAVMTVSAAIVSTVIDYQYKAWLAEAASGGELAQYLAVVSFAMNSLALLTQLLVVQRLLRVVGVTRAVQLMPAVVLLGSVALGLGGGLVAVLALFGVNRVFKHTVHNTSMELLYLPVPAARRATARALVAGVAQRGGKAVASVGLLALPLVGDPSFAVALTLVGLSAFWSMSALQAGRRYLELFRRQLREGRLDSSTELPPLDVSGLEALIASLSSSDDLVVTGALQLLARQQRGRVIPAVLLYHPSKSVVLQALEIFADSGRTDFIPIAQRLFENEDPELRIGALFAVARVGTTPVLLERAAADIDTGVRAAAVVAYLATTPLEGNSCCQDAQSMLDSLFAAGDPRTLRTMAQAICTFPNPVFSATVTKLVGHRDEEVVAAAVKAMAAMPRVEFIPSLMECLVDRRQRPAARRALVMIGEPAFIAVCEALEDVKTPLEVRRQLPQTLSQFEELRTGRTLLGLYLTEPDGVTRYKILRGLGSLRRRMGSLRLDRTMLERAIESTLRTGLWALEVHSVIESGRRRALVPKTQGGELLLGLFEARRSYSIERVTRLLGLLHDEEDFEKIYAGLMASDSQRSAAARELLETVVSPQFRAAVLALVEDGDPVERLERARPLHEVRDHDYVSVLGALLDSRSEVVTALAAYHVTELGMVEFDDRIARLEPVSEGAAQMLGSLTAMAREAVGE